MTPNATALADQLEHYAAGNYLQPHPSDATGSRVHPR